jgi:DNA-binding transcriptional ArsR family regulator
MLNSIGEVKEMKASDFEQVDFFTNPALEFINALFALAGKEKLQERGEKVNFSPDSEEVNLHRELKENLSDYMLKEVDYFFDQEFPFGHLIGTKVVINNPELDSVDKLISHLENSSSLKLLNYILEEEGLTCPGEVEEMLSAVDGAQNLTSKEKKILTETINNPTETLQRYWFMLRQVYLKAYQKMEEKILQKLATQVKKFELIFEKKADYFFRYYLNLPIREIDLPVNIHVSFFLQTLYQQYEEKDNFWINMGYHLDKVYGEQALRKRIQEFLKFVADDSRFKMLELLGEGPHYGRELADKLDLKPSTVSYHLSRLEKMDLVAINRKKHKVYYSLVKTRLEELFKQAGDFILHRC